MTKRSFKEEMETLSEQDWSGTEDEAGALWWISGCCCLPLIAPPLGLIVGLIMLIRRDLAFAALAVGNAIAGAAFWTFAFST